MKIKRKIIVSDSILDLSAMPSLQKKALLPFMVKAVGFIMAIKILFGKKKDKK